MDKKPEDFILSAEYEGGAFQPYMTLFAKTWQNCGGKALPDIKFPHRLRQVFGRIACFPLCTPRKRLLILSGRRMETASWPWCYLYEIVPVMWDVWPVCVKPLVKFVRRNRVRLMFVTSSQQVGLLRTLLPDVRVEWMPEAVDVASYPLGPKLVERTIDVIEYGRRMGNVHDALTTRQFNRNVNLQYSKGQWPTFELLAEAIRNAKISICYPQCDTRPEYAGNVETLTQRYWEAMASGTLVAGRAPQELIDLCGYNPVITLGKHPAEQIEQVLNEIDQGKWQDLADRNRSFVEQHADWSVRIKEMKRALEET